MGGAGGLAVGDVGGEGLLGGDRLPGLDALLDGDRLPRLDALLEERERSS